MDNRTKEEIETELDYMSQKEHGGDSISEYEKRRDEYEYGE